MKIFTDLTQTSFFKTDNYLKNLQPLEINSIEKFIYHSFDPKILLGASSLMVKRFDELEAGSPGLDGSDEPELIGEWLDIDFVADMKLLDILFEITKFIDIDSDFLKELEEARVFQKMTEQWINDDEDQTWTITAWDDPRKLCIRIDENGELTCAL